MFLTRPLISVSARRWWLEGWRGRERPERVDDKATVSPVPPSPLALSHAVPSILAEARDSFERTAFRVTARVTTTKSLYNVNSPSTLKLNLSYLIFVISNFLTILLWTVTGNSIESRNKKNFILSMFLKLLIRTCNTRVLVLDEENRCIIRWMFWDFFVFLHYANCLRVSQERRMLVLLRIYPKQSFKNSKAERTERACWLHDAITACELGNGAL